MATIDARHGGLAYFRDLDGDKKLEFIGNDFTFAYVYTDFADSPAPTIILRFQDDHYVLAGDLMRKPAPPASEIESRSWRFARPSLGNRRVRLQAYGLG